MDNKSYRSDPTFITHKKYLELFFEYFYQRFSGVGKRSKPNLNYVFKPTETGQKHIRNFILDIAKDNISSFGPTFYFNYFAFHWNYWSGTEKIKTLTINIGWILDKNAYERWLNRNTDFDYVSYEFCQKYKIDKLEVIKKVTRQIEDRHTSAGEEFNRKVYENGNEKRLVHCYMTTSLFSPRSKTCLTCNDKKICKELLKTLYPQLAEKKLNYAGKTE